MKKFASLALVILLIAAFMVPAASAWTYIPSLTRVAPPTSISFDAPAELGGSGSFYEAPAAPAPVSYSMIKVTAVWTKGVPANFVSDAPFDKFDAVLIDNAVVPAEMYEAVSGSTDVTISDAYMETLEIGTHTIVIKSKDGQASATFAVAEAATAATGSETATGSTGSEQSGASAGAEQAAAADASASAAADAAAAAAAAAAATASASTPKTGDESHTILWAAISLVTLGAIGVVALPLVKKTKVED